MKGERPKQRRSLRSVSKRRQPLKSERVECTHRKAARKRASFLFGSNRRFVLTPLPTVHKRIAALFLLQSLEFIKTPQEVEEEEEKEDDGDKEEEKNHSSGLYLMWHAKAKESTSLSSSSSLVHTRFPGTEGLMEIQVQVPNFRLIKTLKL